MALPEKKQNDSQLEEGLLVPGKTDAGPFSCDSSNGGHQGLESESFSLAKFEMMSR